MSFAAVADQFEFEGFPVFHAEATEGPLSLYLRLSRERGGLVPQSLLGACLGVSKQRVGQLISEGRFEVHEIAGKNYVTGDSLETFCAEERKAGRVYTPPKFSTIVHAVREEARASGRVL